MVRKYLVFCAYIVLGIIILCFFLFNNKKDTPDCLVYPCDLKISQTGEFLYTDDFL